MKNALLGYIVDDDEAIRSATEALREPAGYRVQLFDSADALLASPKSREADCSIVNIQMPRMTGLEVNLNLTKRDIHIPAIFITAFADDKICNRGTKIEAVAHSAEPVSGAVLLENIKVAVDHDEDLGSPSSGSSE
jgi:FixJ family two-component response regulator